MELEDVSGTTASPSIYDREDSRVAKHGSVGVLDPPAFDVITGEVQVGITDLTCSVTEIKGLQRITFSPGCFLILPAESSAGAVTDGRM